MPTTILWVEACDTTVYLHNQIPRLILVMITSMKVFSGRMLDVSLSRIFGASFYHHASNESRKKLEPTIELGVFMGYTKTSQNYYVYLSSLIMKFVWRDVKVDEEKAMWCSLEKELQIPVEEDILAPKEETHKFVE